MKAIIILLSYSFALGVVTTFGVAVSSNPSLIKFCFLVTFAIFILFYVYYLIETKHKGKSSKEFFDQLKNILVDLYF